MTNEFKLLTSLKTDLKLTNPDKETDEKQNDFKSASLKTSLLLTDVIYRSSKGSSFALQKTHGNKKKEEMK